MKRLVAGIVVAFGIAGTAHAEDAHTLREVMKHLGMQVHDLSDALVVADFEKLARSAQGIAGHSHISAQEEHRIEATLGKDAAHFKEADERVHHAAMELAEAAQAKNASLSARRYGEMMEGCVACHSAFRSRLRQ